MKKSNASVFGKWLADSKVFLHGTKSVLKNESGMPLTLYHGGLVWDKFESEKSGRDALWLTPDISTASGYADQFSPQDGREIKAFHVVMAKPLDLRKPSVVELVFGEEDAPEPHEMARDRALIEAALKYAKSNDYDGLIHPDSDNFNRYSNGYVSYAVFSADQLQLAPLTGKEQDGNTHGIPMRGALDEASARFSASRDHVDITAFKKWFGDSVVTDTGKPGGMPLMVYHGTEAEFSIFKPSQDGTAGPGIYFSSSPITAKAWSYRGKPENFRLISAYVALQKPYQMRAGGKAPDPKILRELGHDGVIISAWNGYKDYVIFKPAQIKSATDNNGDFDTSNADIRFSFTETEAGCNSDEAEQEAFGDQERP